MQTLIKDLLDYSRIGHDKTKTLIDCNKILQDVLQDLNTSIKESNARIDVGKLPVIKGYTDIKSLFQNLISNAIKFRKKDTAVNINVYAEANYHEWIFKVQDNGIGIEKKYHERIFTIFQKLHSQKHYAGTGIGLALCKKIVELHGGKIWVESDPKKGTTFYFTIPETTIV
jgi:light-regulated signal transduction histidine kinase (bacteriophytochrome)